MSQKSFKVTTTLVSGQGSFVLMRDVLLGAEEAPAVRISVGLDGLIKVTFIYTAMRSGISIGSYFARRWSTREDRLRHSVAIRNLQDKLSDPGQLSAVEVQAFMTVFQETENALIADLDKLKLFLAELSSGIALDQELTPFGV